MKMNDIYDVKFSEARVSEVHKALYTKNYFDKLRPGKKKTVTDVLCPICDNT